MMKEKNMRNCAHYYAFQAAVAGILENRFGWVDGWRPGIDVLRLISPSTPRSAAFSSVPFVQDQFSLLVLLLLYNAALGYIVVLVISLRFQHMQHNGPSTKHRELRRPGQQVHHVGYAVVHFVSSNGLAPLWLRRGCRM